VQKEIRKFTSKSDYEKVFEFSEILYGEAECEDKDFNELYNKFIELLQGKRNRIIHRCKGAIIIIKNEFGDVYAELIRP